MRKITAAAVQQAKNKRDTKACQKLVSDRFGSLQNIQQEPDRKRKRGRPAKDCDGNDLVLPENLQDKRETAEILRAIFRSMKKMILEYESVRRLIYTTLALIYDQETA